jgi:trans-2,3-dihydro-3-hydroxyanthranilate isomerase
MPYRFHTADVFTSTMFGGNQLAVLPDARGLSDAQMLAITREFNYSESTFVFPPSAAAHTRRVRIFTPGGEIPFAGHPTVGTAIVLAQIGEIPLTGAETPVIFEEGVGPVPVRIRAEGGKPTFAQLTVAKLPEVSTPPATAAQIAAAVSLSSDDLVGGDYVPQVVSCGLPFLFVAVRDRGVVARARVRIDLWEQHLAGSDAAMLFVFAADAERPGSDIRARMFCPGIGVPEDPATGSACAALGGYLGVRTPREGLLRWVVEQGFEMGRPSIIEVEADKRAGAITGVRVGGSAVLVSEGSIDVR